MNRGLDRELDQGETALLEPAAAALSAHLLASRTVTEGLHAWCEARGIGNGPITVLCCAQGEAGDALPAFATALGLIAEPLQRRRIVLGRAGIALAEAENIFLPGRLTPAMREALASTDTPFGAVIAPFNPARRTLSVRLGHEAGPPAVLSHEALVLGQDGAVLAAVAERFLPALLTPAPG